jgi:putative transposase
LRDGIVNTDWLYRRLNAPCRKKDGKIDFRIHVANAVETANADLQIEPYLYGYWLGNGCATEARITVQTCDVDEVSNQIKPYHIIGRIWDNNGDSKHLYIPDLKSEPVDIRRKIWYNRVMRYTSDLTNSQWDIIKPLLGKTRNRKYDKRELVNAVLYIVKTGCQWRNLPKDFPEWNAVYHFFSRAKKKGVWDIILDKLVEMTRIKAGRNSAPSYALIDSQSVKTVYASDNRGYDGGKKQKDENDT